MPMGAIRKVCVWMTLAILNFRVICRLECTKVHPSVRTTQVGAQGSISRPNVTIMRSLIKFMVAPELMRVTIVEKRPIRKT